MNEWAMYLYVMTLPNFPQTQSRADTLIGDFLFGPMKHDPDEAERTIFTSVVSAGSLLPVLENEPLHRQSFVRDVVLKLSDNPLDDNTIRLFQADDHEFSSELDVNDRLVDCGVCVDPETQTLSVTLVLMKRPTWTRPHRPCANVYGMAAWHPTKAGVYAATHCVVHPDRQLVQCHVDKPEYVKQLYVPGSTEERVMVNAHRLTWHPGGELLAITSSHLTQVWNVVQNKVVFEQPTELAMTVKGFWDSTGTVFAISASNRVVFFDLDGTQISESAIPDTNHIAWHPTEKSVYLVNRQEICIVPCTGHDPVGVVFTNDLDISHASWSPDGTQVAVATRNEYQIDVWDATKQPFQLSHRVRTQSRTRDIVWHPTIRSVFADSGSKSTVIVYLKDRGSYDIRHELAQFRMLGDKEPEDGVACLQDDTPNSSSFQIGSYWSPDGAYFARCGGSGVFIYSGV